MSKLYHIYNLKGQSTFSNYKKGLQNLGNTCFLNSILQCLRINLDFSNYFLQKEFYSGDYSIIKTELNKKKTESFLTIGWYELLKDLWNDDINTAVNPKKFFNYYQKVSKELKRYNFCGNNQNDAEEFLLFFLNCIHDSLSDKDLTITVGGDISNKTDELQKKFYEFLKKHLEIEGLSIIKGLFTGFQISTIENSHNDKASYNFEPFVYINLEIPNNSTTIHECMYHYTKTSQLDKDYKQKEFPENTTYHKTTKFISLPHHLIIVLKRFKKKITSRGIQLTKNTDLINYPLELDMNSYTYGYSNNTNSIYDLQAVTFHTGNLGGGHYYCIGKSKNNEWILYNDAQTGIIQENQSKIINNEAYILFYQKRK